MTHGESATATPIFTELDQLESSLSRIAANVDMHTDITRRLQVMLSNWIEAQGEVQADSEIELDSATPDELFNFLDNELGL
jgi:hypothetical protein